MEPLLVFPDPPPPVLSQGLDLAGYPWTRRRRPRPTSTALEPADGWPGAVIVGA